MIKNINSEMLKEAMDICFEMEECYFTIPFNERLKIVFYIYNLLSEYRTISQNKVMQFKHTKSHDEHKNIAKAVA